LMNSMKKTHREDMDEEIVIVETPRIDIIRRGKGRLLQHTYTGDSAYLFIILMQENDFAPSFTRRGLRRDRFEGSKKSKREEHAVNVGFPRRKISTCTMQSSCSRTKGAVLSQREHRPEETTP